MGTAVLPVVLVLVLAPAVAIAVMMRGVSNPSAALGRVGCRQIRQASLFLLCFGRENSLSDPAAFKLISLASLALASSLVFEFLTLFSFVYTSA